MKRCVQTSSAQTNVVHLAVPLPLWGAVVERLCSLLSFLLAVPHPRRAGWLWSPTAALAVGLLCRSPRCTKQEYRVGFYRYGAERFAPSLQVLLSCCLRIRRLLDRSYIVILGGSSCESAVKQRKHTRQMCHQGLKRLLGSVTLARWHPCDCPEQGKGWKEEHHFSFWESHKETAQGKWRLNIGTKPSFWRASGYISSVIVQ